MEQETICNKCKALFSITNESIKSSKELDIEVSYFKCPYCKEIYITRCTNDYIRREEVKLRHLFRNTKMRSDKKFIRSWERVKIITDRLKQEVLTKHSNLFEDGK